MKPSTIFIYIDNFNFDGSDIFSCDADHLTLYNNYTYKPVFNPKSGFDVYYTYLADHLKFQCLLAYPKNGQIGESRLVGHVQAILKLFLNEVSTSVAFLIVSCSNPVK